MDLGCGEGGDSGCGVRAVGLCGVAGRGGLRGCNAAGPRPRSPARSPPRPRIPAPARGPGRGARGASPTWAFCRALRRSSCTKGFRPGGASRRASPAPELEVALEVGASRGPRPRSLMAAPPSARGAGEPGAERGAEPSGERSAARAEDARSAARARRAAAQAPEGRWRDVGGGRRGGASGDPAHRGRCEAATSRTSCAAGGSGGAAGSGTSGPERRQALTRGSPAATAPWGPAGRAWSREKRRSSPGGGGVRPPRRRLPPLRRRASRGRVGAPRSGWAQPHPPPRFGARAELGLAAPHV